MLAELKAKSQVTVPNEIITELGLNEGDKFEVSIQNGAIYMMPIVAYPRHYVEKLEAQANEAIELISSGKLRVYESPEELLFALHAEGEDDG